MLGAGRPRASDAWGWPARAGRPLRAETPEPSRTPDALISTDPEGFVRAEGRHLVLGDERVRLKAVNFSNFYHRHLTGADLRSSAHHSRVLGRELRRRVAGLVGAR